MSLLCGLGEQQLSELDKLQIVPEGRKSVRIFRAGYLAPVMIKAIGQKLAAAGVQDANFYPDGMHGQKVENWREYLARERQNLSDGLVIELPVKQKAQLSQMADSERAQLLADRFDGVCVHPESEIVHVWRGGVWCPVSTMELSREMVAIYSEHRATFSKRVINNAVEALKVIAEPMGEPSGDLLPFANGALDLKTGNFPRTRRRTGSPRTTALSTRHQHQGRTSAITRQTFINGLSTQPEKTRAR